MKNTILMVILCLLMACLLTFTGCKKDESPASPTVSETFLPMETNPPQAEIAQEQERVPSFSYKPGFAEAYIKADPSIEAGPEALGDIPLKVPEDTTLNKVSNCQYDFIRKGRQGGGLLIVDLPDDLLDKAKDTKEDWLALGDCLRKQVMTAVDPDAFPINGGGEGYGCYLSVTFDGLITHWIFRGEKYCYDLWIDWGMGIDPGPMLESMAACEDIKPELNDIAFHWSMQDEPKQYR